MERRRYFVIIETFSPTLLSEERGHYSLSESYIGVLHREQNSNLQVESSSLVALDCSRGLTRCFEPYIYGYLTHLVFIRLD